MENVVERAQLPEIQKLKGTVSWYIQRALLTTFYFVSSSKYGQNRGSVISVDYMNNTD